MNLVLLGPPGVGKGTQGALLAESSGMRRIATGDLLRREVRRGSELGKQARAYTDAGELVPDELILELLRREILDCGSCPGTIFDGFPRNMAQAEALDALLAELGQQLDGVLVFEAPEELLVKRLSGRRYCPNCEKNYNIFFQPPAREGICDACGEELVTRADDDAGAVRRRLQIYREDTYPLIAYYRDRPVPLLSVDGEGTVEHVTRALQTALDSS